MKMEVSNDMCLEYDNNNIINRFISFLMSGQNLDISMDELGKIVFICKY